MLDSELFTGFFGITSNTKRSGKRLYIKNLTSTGFSCPLALQEAVTITVTGGANNSRRPDRTCDVL